MTPMLIQANVDAVIARLRTSLESKLTAAPLVLVHVDDIAFALFCLRDYVPREDREEALLEYGKAIHLRHMGEAGATLLLGDADKCRTEARRLLKLEPQP